MRWLPLIALVSGCFYWDRINQRPGVTIDQLPIEDTTDNQVHRGEPHLRFSGVSDDPDGDAVRFHWIIRTCDDGMNPATCDDHALVESLLPDVDFPVPLNRLDVARPIQSLLVTLTGEDAYGAQSRPVDVLVLPVLDALPEVTIDDQSSYESTINTPIDLFALYSDVDDDVDTVTIEWKAFSPALTEATLVDLTVPPPQDPTQRQVGKRLVPDLDGQWTIRVIATDPTGGGRVVDHPLLVNLDEPPCIDLVSPEPIQGQLVSDPTVFTVLVVSDALDSYPTILGDPLRGATQFQWSVKRNNGPRQLIASASGNGFDFDPSSFALGDTVELRVEVFDRHATPVNCADDQATCALVATKPDCIQRQTWSLEVR